jgi:NADPH:quinone reductase-like Zn-dependent oxidoreductase
MQAVRLHGAGGIDDLVVEEVEVPAVGPDEELVRVHAASITRDELDWPVDRLPAIPSYELSGTVVASGEEVFALTAFDRDGVAAEYAVVQEQLLVPKPRTLAHVESAAIPLAGLSAWQGLFDHGRLAAGERVLILGAGGGVGGFASQLARWCGAEVVDEAAGADLVFDTAGGAALRRAAELLRPDARLVSVAEEPPAPGTYFVVEPNREQLGQVARLAEERLLRPAIDSVFPLADARAAFERVAARGKSGKVVLRLVDE